MMKKKLLARSVVLGLLCASVLPLARINAANFMHITDSKEIVHYGNSFSGITWVEDIDGDGYTDVLEAPKYTSSEQSNRGFYITGNTDKTIKFTLTGDNPYGGIALDYNTGYGESIGIENNTAGGVKTIIDTDYSFSITNNLLNGYSTAAGISKQYSILNVLGDISFTNKVYLDIDSGATEKIAIVNYAGNTVDFQKGLSIGGDGSNGIGIKNEGNINIGGQDLSILCGEVAIKNAGNMNIELEDYMSINRWYYTTPICAIENTGDLRIRANVIDINDSIHNTGTINIQAKSLAVSSTGSSGIAFSNSGNAEVNVDNLNINQIDNNAGNFKISAKSININNIINNGNLLQLDSDNNSDTVTTNITGEIRHSLVGETTINISSSNDNYALFSGIVTRSNEKFKLNLGKNTIWEASNQLEEVEGLYMNDSCIQLNSDRYVYDNNNHPIYPWGSGYSTLKLKNFQAISGVFNITTDLMNNAGDKLVFNGTTPADARLGVMIWNNGNSGGTEHPNDGIHKVTIIDAPRSTNMNFTCWLGFYDNFNEYLLYKPIVEEAMTGDRKLWNFVGWERSGNKTTKKESDQQKDAFDLNSTELDNTLKRLNDIRTDPSEVGVWLRGESGKMKIRSYSYDYNIMSGGYDWDFDSNAAKMFLGFGISYAKNDCDTGIIGNTKSMGYNLYGSWLGKENKDYVDVIVKYGTLDKDYAGLDDNNVFVKGDYDKNLFSIAAKYGRRIERADGWYWEPSVGLTWGRISSADYTDSQGIKIHADSSTSKMASLGVQVGKNVKGTEYYGKFEVRHDFDGKMHVSVPDSTLPGSSVYDDMGGTWYKVGIGAARKIDKNNSFYIDIEKDFGNKVKKPYSIGAGYRYTW